MNTLSLSTPLTMSSREIAELTNKEHFNVLRDIRATFEEEINALKIEAVNFTDKKGETRQEFLLDKEQCLVLLSGYSVELRKKIIKRWQELEKGMPTIPQTYSQALRAYAEEVEAKELALKQLEITNDTLKIFHKANEAILNRNDDVIECKAKEFKTVHAKLKSDIGVEINEIVYQIFLPKGDENYSEAHRQSKQKFFIETGIHYIGAKKTSLDTKKQYLRWLQSQV